MGHHGPLGRLDEVGHDLEHRAGREPGAQSPGPVGHPLHACQVRRLLGGQVVHDQGQVGEPGRPGLCRTDDHGQLLHLRGRRAGGHPATVHGVDQLLGPCHGVVRVHASGRRATQVACVSSELEGQRATCRFTSPGSSTVLIAPTCSVPSTSLYVAVLLQRHCPDTTPHRRPWPGGNADATGGDGLLGPVRAPGPCRRWRIDSVPEPETVGLEVARVLDHPAGKALFAAWAVADDRKALDELLGTLHEPGPIALRCRMRHLLDPGRAQPPAGALATERPLWDSILAAETRGDVLLRMGPGHAAAAREAFETALALEPTPSHRVVTVNALLGLADLARQVDDTDTCLDLLQRAAQMADADGYRFGRMRALVSLGYVLVVALSSATAAAESFDEASRLALEIGDRLFRANAELGLSECCQRRRDLDGARVHAEAALEVFEALRSPGGVGNAASRLADVLLHAGDRVRARTLLQRAADAFAEAEVSIGRIGALDLLGDVEIEDRYIRSAVEHHRLAYELADREDYPRGRANALAGLAHAARVTEVWAEGHRLGSAALTAFRGLGDPLGEVNALEGLAVCAVATDDLPSAVLHRCAAVRTLEAMRADLTRHDLQAEYRSRFERTYLRAVRTAVDAEDGVAMLWLMECLAGRRLAGLVERGAAGLDPSRAELLGQFAARANQSWREPVGDAWQDRRTRVVRKLGALAIGSTTVEPAAAALEDMIATLYLPPPDHVDPLTEALPTVCDLFVVEIGLSSAVHWVMRDSGGQLHCGAAEIDELAVLLDRLDGTSAAGLRLLDLAPLGAVLPARLVDRLAGGSTDRLLVVPIGRARVIPWNAVPLRTGVLGEHSQVAVCPSLTVQRALAARAAARPPWPVRPSVHLWRHPGITHHQLDRFLPSRRFDLVRLATADAALAELSEPRCDLLALAVHGRPTPGGGHHLELDDRAVLIQADCIGARPPRKIALIACWGGQPPDASPDSDPISIASLLLAAGSDQVAATTAELGDSAHATRYVEFVLDGLSREDAPAAVHRAVARFLRDPHLRAGPIRHWAPMQAYGTFSTRPGSDDDHTDAR